jgi:hypothetical protein
MVIRNITIPAATATFITTTGFGDPILIENEGADVLYIGSASTVTNLTGFGIPAVPSVLSRLDLRDYEGKIYGYSTAGCSVRIIEEVSG